MKKKPQGAREYLTEMFTNSHLGKPVDEKAYLRMMAAIASDFSEDLTRLAAVKRDMGEFTQGSDLDVYLRAIHKKITEHFTKSKNRALQ